MAKLRKGIAYRKLERPYTRVSKYRKKSFIRVTPTRKIVRFDMGELTKPFTYTLHLLPKASLQIRQEAMEAARQTCVRLLEKRLGKGGFYYKIRIYPYHILRENALASGAGADRMSTGMARPFGKPIGVAAQVKERQKLMSVGVEKENIGTATMALKRASKKLPCAFQIVVEETPSKKAVKK